MPQDRSVCIGRPLLKAPRGLPTVSAQSRILRRQATSNGAGGYHRRNIVHSGAATVEVTGLGSGVDSINLQHWLQFGLSSLGLK